MVSSTGHIVAIVFLVIFLILFAVFLGLYIWTRNNLNTCLASTGATGPCPPCPPTSVSPTDQNITVAGAAPGEGVNMQCPIGQVIRSYKLYTTVVDSGGVQNVQNISNLINPLGRNNFTENSDRILAQGNILPDCYQRRKGVIPTRVLFGTYLCGR